MKGKKKAAKNPRSISLNSAAEVDFKIEAENALRFARNFDGDNTVRIPKVVGNLSTTRVLCIEYLEGVKIRNAREEGCDMSLVGRRYLHVAYQMLFSHGFFHGDLHPGNVLVLPGEVLGLLDFGMVGRLTRDMQDNIVTLIFALERGDFRTMGLPLLLAGRPPDIATPVATTPAAASTAI